MNEEQWSGTLCYMTNVTLSRKEVTHFLKKVREIWKNFHEVIVLLDFYYALEINSQVII